MSYKDNKFIPLSHKHLQDKEVQTNTKVPSVQSQTQLKQDTQQLEMEATLLKVNSMHKKEEMKDGSTN